MKCSESIETLRTAENEFKLIKKDKRETSKDTLPYRHLLAKLESIFRGIFRTQSNMNYGAVAKNRKPLQQNFIDV